MKAVEVHNLDDPQLVEFVDSARQEVFNLRFQHATGQLENTGAAEVRRRRTGAGADDRRQRGIDVEAEITQKAA